MIFSLLADLLEGVCILGASIDSFTFLEGTQADGVVFLIMGKGVPVVEERSLTGRRLKTVEVVLVRDQDLARGREGRLLVDFNDWLHLDFIGGILGGNLIAFWHGL